MGPWGTGHIGRRPATCLARQRGEHRHQLAGQLVHRVRRRFADRPEERRQLDCRCSLGSFSTRHDLCASFISPSPPSGALSAIQARALRRPKRLVAKLRIAHLRRDHCEEQFLCYAICLQSMLR